MPRQRHVKPDANQAEIVGQLRDLGFVVHNVSSLGGDTLDLFVLGLSYKRDLYEWVQVEVKDTGGTLTCGEECYLDYVEAMGGLSVPVVVAWSLDDVLDWYGWSVT